MPAILYGFLGIWRRYFPTVAALLSLASIIGVACNAAAEEPKHIRITLARSVSAIPLWGIGPFAEKAGFRVEYIPAGTNADMQRNLQSGIELGTLGYQSPAVMAEQNVANVKIGRNAEAYCGAATKGNFYDRPDAGRRGATSGIRGYTGRR